MSARRLGGNLVGMASTTPSALVAGAGVGGLAAAVALQRAGVAVTVVERSPRLEAPGAGLSLWPNAVLALRDLDAAGAVQRLEIPRAATGLWRWDGVPLAVDDPAELEGRYGAPLVLVHRAELQQALLAAFGAGTLVLGEQVVHVRQDEAGVTAGLSGGRTLRADVLIGADGLRSVVRSAVLGDEPPSYSGLVAFRGVIEGMDVAPAGEFWGPHAVFGVAPLSHGRAYWYATRRVDDPEAPPPAAVDDLEQLRGDFAAWADPVPRVLAVTTASGLLRHALYDRPPAACWSDGRVALLGDAAHPMLPFLGQGAGQALEDAVALGAAVRRHGTGREALAAYEGARRARANGLVTRSRRAGDLAHLRFGWQRALRNAAVRRVPRSARLRQLDVALGARS